MDPSTAGKLGGRARKAEQLAKDTARAVTEGTQRTLSFGAPRLVLSGNNNIFNINVVAAGGAAQASVGASAPAGTSAGMVVAGPSVPSLGNGAVEHDDVGDNDVGDNDVGDNDVGDNDVEDDDDEDDASVGSEKLDEFLVPKAKRGVRVRALSGSAGRPLKGCP